MKPITRRAALVFAVFALAGCASQIKNITPVPADQASRDVNTIAAALSAVLNTLVALGANVPADVLDKIKAEIATINAAAAEIGNAVGRATAPAASWLTMLQDAVSVVATLVTPFFPAASVVGSVINAALSLLPSVLAIFGTTVSARLKAPAHAYDPNEARTILLSAANKGVL